jgi:hypothetical protein
VRGAAFVDGFLTGCSPKVNDGCVWIADCDNLIVCRMPPVAADAFVPGFRKNCVRSPLGKG